MIKVDLEEAESRLGDLIEEAAAGEEVIISSQGAAVRLVAIAGATDSSELPASPESGNVVGHALDRFIGTWSAEQEAELLAAIEVFEQVDESFWR